MQEFHASKYLATRSGQVIDCESPVLPYRRQQHLYPNQEPPPSCYLWKPIVVPSLPIRKSDYDLRTNFSTSHIDLLRTDSGNSSLNTIDSASNSSGSSSSNTSRALYNPDYPSLDDIILLNVYIPEVQSEFDITCSRRQSIWRVKIILLGRCHQQLKQNALNYGLFTFVFEQFLNEELTLADYFPDTDHHQLDFDQRPPIRLELLYKQRINYGEVMSTLPLASTTRKKRKRSRLLSAIQNCNLDKIAKTIVNCDPNFVDESSGDTPLSLAASATANQQHQANLQQIIVAIVNGGALLDFRTKDGRTALHVAVQKSNFVALKTLLDLGASPNYLDVNGLTPLYYSVIHKANPKLTQLMLHEHATHGITDQHGWQEVHHAAKLGLATHLEHLLFYGCDMNCRIVGSGNTPLHVAAINDQMECARILLLRGCDTSVVNNSHQNAYQVAVIASNMTLADMIKNHKPENVVPYRDKPRFNPARRPQNQHHQGEVNGTHRPTSPSLSQTTNNTTTTSSGVCCDEEDEGRKAINNGNAEDDDEECGDEEEERSSDSEDSQTFLPGMTVRASADYNSGDPSHLQLRRNDTVLLLPSAHSPPTIAFQKLLLGRRVEDGKEGFFPACCVEKIKHHKHQNGDDGERVEGRRDMKMKVVQSATLPTRGRRGARKCLLDKGVTRQYQERTVTLHRGSKGFGFVLRGAKDSSPILSKQLMHHGSPLPLIGLQYFDEIEADGVADAAGLKRGDFLLAVNDVDVRHMSHENVVQLIRQSGDKVTMTIATAAPKQLVSILKKKGRSNKPPSVEAEENKTNGTTDTLPSSQSQTQMSQSVYGSFNNKGAKAPPPAPPKRDPSTTLSTSRARARSLIVPSEVRSAHNQTMALMMMKGELGTNMNDSKPDDGTKFATVDRNNKVASIRSRSSRRISSYELNEFITRPADDSKPDEAKPADKPSEVNSEVKSSPKTSTSQTGSPSIQTSIVKVTLAKPQPAEISKSSNGTDNATRSLTSFQPATSSAITFTADKPAVAASDAMPKIPEPDYSSDEEDKAKTGSVPNGDLSKAPPLATGSDADNVDSSSQAAPKKLTTTATVILKSSSPCPPEATSEQPKNGLFSSKNMFEELREQSAKITGAARLRFANNRQASQDDKLGPGSEPVNNVMKNVAEFERRLSVTKGEPASVATSIRPTQADIQQQLRMSKSCIEEFVPNNVLKKDYSTLTKSSIKQTTAQQDSRRNSAIISAIAEKVAAVNQLVAEQQQGGTTGSKSLNSSPIPTSLSKQIPSLVSGVVVQKPVAVMPGSGGGTLTRRCVTVCEDPVKNIHLQQQHQQLRSQMTGQVSSGGAQLVKPKHSSLAESTSSILKQTSKTLPRNVPFSPNSPIDLVPPPPEFAAAAPPNQMASVSGHAIPPNLRPQSIAAQQQQQQQKQYVQRQLQSSTSPLTIQTSATSGVPLYHHHHHHQLVEGGQQTQTQQQQQPVYSQQGHQHYHMQHNHAPMSSVSLSSSAPTSSDSMALMRSALAQSGQPVSGYTEYTGQVPSQSKAAQLVNAHHQIYGQQGQQPVTSQQQQNQLILQQRAIAVANAKLLQQQQQQHLRSQSVGQYNTLTGSKPQQVQYYVTSQAGGQQNPQYFATLSRHQHAQVQQQYLNSLSSHQQQMQQQQFATLTRHHQQQLQQQLQPALQQGQLNYSQLLQQRQVPNTRLVPVQSMGNRQTPPPAKVTQYAPATSGQYQYQSPATVAYARKSMVEWTADDVQEWLSRIGMAEHRSKFECFNGAKMLRLDNNSLANIGVRQQQHRIYILEKLKQQIWQNHQ